jgi:hypothetical protein
MGSSRNFIQAVFFHPSSAAMLSVVPVKAMGSSRFFSSRPSWFSSVLGVVLVKPVMMMVLLLPALLCCLLLLFLRLPCF